MTEAARTCPSSITLFFVFSRAQLIILSRVQKGLGFGINGRHKALLGVPEASFHVIINATQESIVHCSHRIDAFFFLHSALSFWGSTACMFTSRAMILDLASSTLTSSLSLSLAAVTVCHRVDHVYKPFANEDCLSHDLQSLQSAMQRAFFSGGDCEVLCASCVPAGEGTSRSCDGVFGGGRRRGDAFAAAGCNVLACRMVGAAFVGVCASLGGSRWRSCFQDVLFVEACAKLQFTLQCTQPDRVCLLGEVPWGKAP